MPELTRFLGIIIRMYAERNAPHHTPHFHAYYQNDTAVYGIESVELISGELPKRQHRFVIAWAELYQDALLDNWRRLHSGDTPIKIPPLK